MGKLLLSGGILAVLLLQGCQHGAIPGETGERPPLVSSPSPLPKSGPRLGDLTFAPVDLSLIPPPIGTGSPAPTRDLTGMPTVQPTNGGLPFPDFQFAFSSGMIQSVAALGAPGLLSASLATWDGYVGTLGGALRDVAGRVVADWAPDAVMIAAFGLVDGDGRNPALAQRPQQASGWIVAFRSPTNDEALLIAVRQDATKVLRLRFKPPITVPMADLPDLTGMVTDSSMALARISDAIIHADAAVRDPQATNVPVLPMPPPTAWFGSVGKALPIMVWMHETQAMAGCAGGLEPCAPDRGLYPDSRWQLFLHQEALADGRKRLVWYAMFVPGPSSSGKQGVQSELKGGIAKVDAKSGDVLMLSLPMRTNPTLYRDGPRPTPVPIPPTAIPVPPGGGDYIPSPTPRPSVLVPSPGQV